MMSALKTPHVFTVPGEHDSVDDAGQKYRSVFGAGSAGDGWYSLDVAGVHLIALVNTLNLRKLGHLGADQLEFVKRTSPACPATLPSSCSATSRCSRCTRNGVGAPTTPRRH